jgi:hypothetical protein
MLRESPNAAAPRFACTGPITYIGQAQVQADIANLKAALASVTAVEAFIPAISPSNVEGRQKNLYYKTEDEYLFAIAEAMHEEYRAIVEAGLLLQIDDPRLVTYYIASPTSTVAECRRWAQARVDALNHALRGIPRERVRFHTCYSINMGPRVHDMALKDIVDVILKVNAGAYSFEAANPRHDEASRGRAAHSRRHHAVDRARGASRAGGRPYRALRLRGRTRARHRRRRLWLRDVCGVHGDPSLGRVGQARRAGRGGSDRHATALAGIVTSGSRRERLNSKDREDVIPIYERQT